MGGGPRVGTPLVGCVCTGGLAGRAVGTSAERSQVGREEVCPGVTDIIAVAARWCGFMPL